RMGPKSPGQIEKHRTAIPHTRCAPRSIIGSLPGEAVRVLLLSDIHSNLEALEACLAAAPPYDIVVNLGDIVGYGGSPNEVIERARELGRFFVRGNHDQAAAGLVVLTDF